MQGCIVTHDQGLMQVNLAALRSQDVQTTCPTSPSIVTIQGMLTQYLQLSLQLFLSGL